MTPRERAQRAVDELLVLGTPQANLRRLAALVTVAAEQLQREVAAARYDGVAWDAIAADVRGHYPSGAWAALGDLVPGGTSTTTVRRFYDRGTS